MRAITATSGTSARARRMRVRAAWYILIFSVLGWPASAAWVWWYMDKFSPFEQLMLFLSWFAITMVCADFLTSAQIHEEAGQSD